MRIELSFEEIINYVEHNYDRVITLKTISPTIIRIGTDVKLPLPLVVITKHIDLDIYIDSIIDNDLYINYIINLSNIENVIAKRFIKNKLKKINSAALICEDNSQNNLVLHLSNITQLKEFLEKLEIININILNNTVSVELNIRS